jgi:hypothetical protein
MTRCKHESIHAIGVRPDAAVIYWCDKCGAYTYGTITDALMHTAGNLAAPLIPTPKLRWILPDGKFRKD